MTEQPQPEPEPSPASPGEVAETADGETQDLAGPEEAAPPRSLRSQVRRQLLRHERERDDPRLLVPTGYRYRRELGRGGMGIVLEAEDLQLGRRVAVKTVHGDDPARIARFRREARLASQLEHPHIVPVYELEERDDGSASLAMRLVEGESLRELLRRPEAAQELTRARVLEIVTAVAQALAYAHDQGVIHRDIKPDNVMLGRFGQVFLTDFGLAKRLGSSDSDDALTPLGGEAPDESFVSQDGSVVGTPAYMAPEQAAGAEPDAQVDVYALGALLYELLTLTPPFQGSSTRELLAQAQAGAPEPPRQRAPGRAIPPELEAIALAGLATARSQRYPSVTALLNDVRAYQEGRAVSVRPDPWGVRLRKWAGRHRLLTSSALTALLVASAAWSVLAVWRARVEDQELARLQRRARATSPYLTGLDLLDRRLDVATVHSQAIPALAEAVQLDPSFAEARFALGRAYQRSRDEGQGLRHMLAALEQQPENAHWLVQVGEVFQFMVAEDDPEVFKRRAGTYFARAAALETEATPFAAVGQAYLLAGQRELAQARAVLEAAVQRAPHLWEVWACLGYVLSEQAASLTRLRYDPVLLAEAERAYRRAYELDPTLVRTLRGMGSVLLHLDRPEEALTFYERALAAGDPRDATDLVNKGLVLYRLGRAPEALATLDAAIALEPENRTAHLNRATTLKAMRDVEGALEAYGRSIALDDGRGPVGDRQGRGTLLMALGRHEEALADYEVALAREPDDAVHWSNRAFARIRLGRFAEAEADLERALELAPHMGAAWLNLAAVAAKRGGAEAEEVVYTRGMQAAPDCGRLWVMRGQLRLFAGRLEEAIADLEQAFEVGSEQEVRDGLPPETVLLLCQAYREAGRPAQSLALLARRGDQLPPRLEQPARSERAQSLWLHGAALAQRESWVEALDLVEASHALSPTSDKARLCARMLAQLGRLDQAFDWLERAVEQGWRNVADLETDAYLEPLKVDRRFTELAARMRGLERSE